MSDELPIDKRFLGNFFVPEESHNRFIGTTWQTKPVFPMPVESGDVRLVLHADGRIEGDAAALRAQLADMKDFPCAEQIVLWLLAEVMERQAQ